MPGIDAAIVSEIIKIKDEEWDAIATMEKTDIE